MKLAIVVAAAVLFAPVGLVAQMAPSPHKDAMPMKAPVPPSKFLSVTFEGRVTTFTVADLLKMPQVTVHVYNAHRDATEEYTGPLVSDVLARAGLSAAHKNEKTILHSSVVATGTDHYFVLYSCAELEPAFTTGQSIIAVMKHGLPDTEGGQIQLINANAAKPARWVHGLSSLTVMSVEQHP